MDMEQGKRILLVLSFTSRGLDPTSLKKKIPFYTVRRVFMFSRNRRTQLLLVTTTTTTTTITTTATAATTTTTTTKPRTESYICEGFPLDK